MATYHFSNKPHATLRSGEKMNVKTHYEYICREGRYAHMKDRSQETLVTIAYGNLPEWSYDPTSGKKDPRKFWAEDEKHRARNARGYREIRIALMEELSDKENIELVETFLRRSGIKDNHVYSYAIHDKKAAFDNGHRNIHAHIMFNEKILEPSRPLPAEQFFKKYTTRKNGQPLGGYKTSRHYSSRETTIAMRQLWEDIVNDKFKELGRDERVSCKSLKEQKIEAEERQDYMTAGLLDRTPAPNIGSLYRNPANMQRIHTLVQDFTEAMEDPEKEKILEQDIQASESDAKERSLLLFAQDLALRNAARQIKEEQEKEKQEEQKREYKALQQQEKEKIKEELEKAPWGVTTEDIITYIEEEKERLQKEVALLYHTYDTTRVPGMTQEDAIEKAFDEVTQGRYKKTKEAFNNAEKTYEEHAAKEKEILYDDSENAAQRYSDYLKKERLLREDREKKEEEYRAIEKGLQEQQKEVQEKAKQIWNAYLSLRKKHLDTLRDIGNAQNRQVLLDNTKKDLQDKSNNVIRIEGVPDTVTRKDALHGIVPLRKLPTYVKDGKQYLVLEKKKNKAKAILLSSKTQDGKASVYKLQTTEADGRRKILSAEKTDESVPLFQSYTMLAKEEKQNKLFPGLSAEKQETIQNAVRAEYKTLFREQGSGKETKREHIQNKDTDIQM